MGFDRAPEQSSARATAGAAAAVPSRRAGGSYPTSDSSTSEVTQRATSPTAAATTAAPAPTLDAEGEREYGSRFLPDYTKRRLLGRGACGAVWLASSERHAGPVAIKQVAKGTGAKHQADEKAANTEIAVGEMFFGPGGVPKLSPQSHPGIRHIARLLDIAETKRDVWLVMEFGGSALSKALMEVKGEFVARGAAQPRERVYRVHHLPLYQAMKRDPRVFKRLLSQIIQALRVLSDHEIVHSDVKPENILVQGMESDGCQLETRLCDFGSAFSFDRPDHLALATPEYMPPEALEACALRHTGKDASGAMQRGRSWSYDMWSLGAIMLELAFGAPHFLSYKCRVRSIDGARDHSLMGLFAVPGRDAERILVKQQEITTDEGLRKALRDAPGVPLDEDGLDLLQGLLEWDPAHRISPAEALNHPYLTAM